MVWNNNPEGKETGNDSEDRTGSDLWSCIECCSTRRLINCRERSLANKSGESLSEYREGVKSAHEEAHFFSGYDLTNNCEWNRVEYRASDSERSEHEHECPPIADEEDEEEEDCLDELGKRISPLKTDSGNELLLEWGVDKDEDVGNGNDEAAKALAGFLIGENVLGKHVGGLVVECVVGGPREEINNGNAEDFLWHSGEGNPEFLEWILAVELFAGGNTCNGGANNNDDHAENENDLIIVLETKPWSDIEAGNGVGDDLGNAKHEGANGVGNDYNTI